MTLKGRPRKYYNLIQIPISGQEVKEASSQYEYELPFSHFWWADNIMNCL